MKKIAYKLIMPHNRIGYDICNLILVCGDEYNNVEGDVLDLSKFNISDEVILSLENLKSKYDNDTNIIKFPYIKYERKTNHIYFDNKQQEIQDEDFYY